MTSFTSGGAEVLVCNLAQAFAAAGHDATVLALSDAAQVGNPLPTEEAMMAEVRRSGATARSLAITRSRNPLAGALALRRALRTIRPDVIHAHSARALPLIASAMPGVPVVLTHHNSRLSFPPVAFRLFDRIVDSYVAISDQCEATLRQHGRKPVHRVANAANARFRAQAPRERPARDPMLLAVGTVSTQKDYPTLIQAARPLSQAMAAQGRNLRILIAGGGPEWQDMQARFAGEPVEFLGPRSDIAALMRQADLFVNCSLWEGFPIALIEAAMSALPIVATDVAGNREMVVPHENGLLVPPSSPQALAEALAMLLSDDALYATLSRGALRTAGRFSIERCAAIHLDLYQELCVQRRPILAPAG